MTKTNVRLNKSKCQQGLDGLDVTYALELDDKEHLYFPKDIQRNSAGNLIVEINCIGGKVKAGINVVHCIRPDNVKPFSIVDAIKLGTVREQIVRIIQEYLQKHLGDQYSDELIQKMRVTDLERNITLPCVDGATPSDVIALLDLALDKTRIFRKRRGKKKEPAYEKRSTTCEYFKPHSYKLKIYDKTEEQHEKGNPLVEKNLLRIEVVFINRSLQRMFGKKRSLSDILTIQAIETTCREFKRELRIYVCGYASVNLRYVRVRYRKQKSWR